MENLRRYGISDPERFAFYEKNRSLISQLLAVGKKSPTKCWYVDLTNGDMFIPEIIKGKDCRLVFIADFYHKDINLGNNHSSFTSNSCVPELYRELYFDCENVRYCLGHKTSRQFTKWPGKEVLEEKVYEDVLDYEFGDFIGQFSNFTLEEIRTKTKASFAVRKINCFRIKAKRNLEISVIKSF